jgi:hypothetical protein
MIARAASLRGAQGNKKNDPAARSDCSVDARPQRNALIDIDRDLSAGLPLARVSRARTIIRICTDTKINAVVNPLGLLIARKNARCTISRTLDGRPQHLCLEGLF